MKLHQKIHGAWILLIGLVILLSGYCLNEWLTSAIVQTEIEKKRQQTQLAVIEQTAENLEALVQLKKRDLETFKVDLTTQASSKKSLYESGVMLHDEKRLLEKQWDIMSTHLLIDADKLKITLLKDQEPFESFNLSSAPIFVGLIDSSSAPKIPNLIRITSKERYAHPERGKAETIDGVLKWTPPQVGTSIRANALGEYVIFTNSPLILHGPPTKSQDHDAYSHLCLSLSLSTAKKIYQETFIGTKMALMMSLPTPENP